MWIVAACRRADRPTWLAWSVLNIHSWIDPDKLTVAAHDNSTINIVHHISASIIIIINMCMLYFVTRDWYLYYFCFWLCHVLSIIYVFHLSHSRQRCSSQDSCLGLETGILCSWSWHLWSRSWSWRISLGCFRDRSTIYQHVCIA